MITSIILLNFPPTLPLLTRTRLRELVNRRLRQLFCLLLITCLPPASPVVVLLARLALVPFDIVYSAHLEAAVRRYADEDVARNVVLVNLAGTAVWAFAPPEVGVVAEGFAGGELVESGYEVSMGSMQTRTGRNLLGIDLRRSKCLNLGVV